MSNMKDISDRAGVSIATVSKVLNGRGTISAETKELVMSIARELNYQPNLYARGLKKGQSRAIGIITEDLTVFNTPPVIDGIGACCEERDYHYFLENMRLDKLGLNPNTQDERSIARLHDAAALMRSMQVDGLIYLSCHSHKIVTLPENQNIPMVCAYCSSSDQTVSSVVYDDTAAALEVTSLLISQGHRCIGTVTGPADSQHTRNRLIGYQEALFQAGLTYNPALTITGDWNRDSGYLAAEQLLARQVTAVFCQNDIMAMGVMDYCTQKGIRIGQDLALIGFDNREISTVCRPALSTVELPLFGIGHQAATLLIDTLEGRDTDDARNILLNCKIIERDSTRLYSVKDVPAAK